MIALGCVADDFTGASDVASFLANAGINTVLYNGIPAGSAAIEDDCQAIVIALKTRTQETAAAVSESLEAFRWLKGQGARQLFIKYCSTFDSTREGNIGPIADAVLETEEEPYTILCPALPVNKRKVKEGRLYVNDVPLDESPMRNHPLTPMWDSRISELMREQSAYPVYNLTADWYEKPDEALKLIEEYKEKHKHFYLVPDYYEDCHAEKIVELFGDLSVLTGGSGLMTALAEKYKKEYGYAEGGRPSDSSEGGAVLLAGSCSVATLAQIEDYQKKGGKSFRIYPKQLMEGAQNMEEMLSFIRENPGEAVLIYSSAPAEELKQMQQESGREQAAALLEQTMAQLAERAVKEGITRVIVAGGETSGAVTRQLGFASYRIGSSIAPGVPVMIPLENEKIRLVLKSGNFVQTDFFTRAL
ncbi:MAG: 3-oxo-tetronate kinase, partial [Lachnospiraceae bacterium]|nr:3-oxo-tetronate kinase [Lachnospiraceae bacterium]